MLKYCMVFHVDVVLNTLYECNGAYVLAINNFKVGNAIHFYVLAYHYDNQL